jgi:hypothetical protein
LFNNGYRFYKMLVLIVLLCFIQDLVVSFVT